MKNAQPEELQNVIWNDEPEQVEWGQLLKKLKET